MADTYHNFTKTLATPSGPALMMKAAQSSEISALIYQTARSHASENRRQNLKSNFL